MSNSSRTIWFLSHRQHYDPRIYHIMSVYRSQGWRTVLFDPPEAQASALEWAELVSPPWQPVGELVLREATKSAATSQVKKFLVDLPSDVGPKLQRRDAVRYQQTVHEGSSLVTFQVDGEAQRYVYDQNADKLWSAPVGQCHAELTALAIAQVRSNADAVTKLAAQLPEFVLENTEPDYILQRPAGYDRGEEYAIDKHTGLVRRRTLPRRYHYQQDLFFGRNFDYTRFKAEVYEYIWEFDLVQLYLAQSTHHAPDAVFISDLPTLPIGVMLKEVFGCKLIIDCHEWWCEQERIWNPEPADKLAAIDRWEKELYTKCDAAITVSNSLAKTMSKHFGISFHYVPTCVFDLPVLPAHNPNFWQERVGLPEGASVALFQGGLSTNRNLENLMRATRYLDDDQYLVICGGGDFCSEMQSILKREGNPDRVRMLGWQPQLDLWQYTMHADLGIIPYTHSLHYYQLSAPNKLSEYHVCQLPMLVDKRMIELAGVVNEDKVGCTADLSDPVAMGQVIASILADKSALQDYRAAYRVASKRFTRAQCKDYLNPILEMA